MLKCYERNKSSHFEWKWSFEKKTSYMLILTLHMSPFLMWSTQIHACKVCSSGVCTSRSLLYYSLLFLCCIISVYFASFLCWTVGLKGDSQFNNNCCLPSTCNYMPILEYWSSKLRPVRKWYYIQWGLQVQLPLVYNEVHVHAILLIMNGFLHISCWLVTVSLLWDCFQYTVPCGVKELYIEGDIAITGVITLIWKVHTVCIVMSADRACMFVMSVPFPQPPPLSSRPPVTGYFISYNTFSSLFLTNYTNKTEFTLKGAVKGVNTFTIEAINILGVGVAAAFTINASCESYMLLTPHTA